jgi:hypothetical protein
MLWRCITPWLMCDTPTRVQACYCEAARGSSSYVGLQCCIKHTLLQKAEITELQMLLQQSQAETLRLRLASVKVVFRQPNAWYWECMLGTLAYSLCATTHMLNNITRATIRTMIPPCRRQTAGSVLRRTGRRWAAAATRRALHRWRRRAEREAAAAAAAGGESAAGPAGWRGLGDLELALVLTLVHVLHQHCMVMVVGPARGQEVCGWAHQVFV